MTVRLGLDYTAAVHQSAGIGRYTREMVAALAAQAGNWPQASYRLFVAGAGPGFTLPARPGPGFSWHPCRLTERWLARLWYRLRLPLPVETWTGRLDLFHQPDFVLPPVRPGTRTIVTVHDLSFVHDPATAMPGMLAHLQRWVPASVDRADHVVAVSQATCRDLIEFYHTPPEKITVLYHGVAPQFQPVREPARLATVRRKYGLDERPFILGLGTIHPRKNFRRLVQAMARIDPAFTLVIGGSKGWSYEEVFDEVAKQGLSDRVQFPGFIAEADLPALYSAARLFVYPSLCEGFGLPLLEAMACGTPVIAANGSALPEVVGPAGLLVDPLDVDGLAGVMAAVLGDPARHRQLSEAGLARAGEFTWAKTAAQLIQLYQEVLQ